MASLTDEIHAIIVTRAVIEVQQSRATGFGETLLSLRVTNAEELARRVFEQVLRCPEDVIAALPVGTVRVLARDKEHAQDTLPKPSAPPPEWEPYRAHPGRP